MLRRAGWTLPGLAVLVLAALVPPRASAAPNWAVGPAAGSATQSRAGALGTTTATASCNGLVGTTINVAWIAVPRATKYAVARFVGGTLSQTFTVIAPTVAYADTGLGPGTYTYKVQAGVGLNWVGVQSAASNSRTVTLGLLCT